MSFDPNKHPFYVVIFAAVVSGAFTAAIMALHVSTEDVVEANQKLLAQRARVELFGLEDLAERIGPAAVVEQRMREVTINKDTKDEMSLLVAYRSDEAARANDWRDKSGVLAYAFDVSGVGFWARIDGLLAVELPADAKPRILGVVFLKHSETPGLGGRITEEEFTAQFRAAHRPGGRAIPFAPPNKPDRAVSISHAKPDPSDAKYARHVDALIGATGTSTAVERFLDEDIRRFWRAAQAANLVDAADEPPTSEEGHAHAR